MVGIKLWTKINKRTELESLYVNLISRVFSKFVSFLGLDWSKFRFYGEMVYTRTDHPHLSIFHFFRSLTAQ